MCGIVGAYHLNGKPVQKEFLKKALDQIQHRGPDEQGYLHEGPIGLGHRRLKIIDLKTGQQPFVNEDKTIWLVLSGEIYNHSTLRGPLLRAGHRFRSRTDAEVALHLYEEHGPGFVNSLRGMFSLVIWDSKEQLLLMARDRLGIHPLYYHWKDGEYLLFASECKSLFCYPSLQHREIHCPSVYKYLLLRYVPGPHTLYEGIYKLPPGHVLTVDKKGIFQINPYWDLSEKAYDDPLSSKEYCSEHTWADGLLSRLEEAVKMHLSSDVPIGILLSGGIDSTALVALVHRLEPHRIRTYSIGLPVSGYDESDHAQQIARQFHTEHTTEMMEPSQFINLLPKLIRYRDSPLSEASEIPLYHIIHTASSDVKVLLTGQGADELFGGYLKYVAEPVIQSVQSLLFPLGRGLISSARRMLPHHSRVLQELTTYMAIEPELERWIAYFASWVPNGLGHLFNSTSHGPVSSKQLLTEFRTLIQRCPWLDPVDHMMLIDLKYWLPDNLLEGGDRMSMAASVESRLPFLDHPLVEFVWRLPSSCKVKGRTTKVIMKKALEGIVPPKVFHRKKNGFAVPLGIWFRGELKEAARQILFSPTAFHRDLLLPGSVSKIWREHQEGAWDHRKILWTLLNLELWHENQ